MDKGGFPLILCHLHRLITLLQLPIPSSWHRFLMSPFVYLYVVVLLVMCACIWLRNKVDLLNNGVRK